MKRPAFQFYPGDWQHDAALRLCSIGARGLWIEMMCVMHQAEPYGHLVLNNGNAIASAQLARMVGASEREVKRGLEELGAAGVYSTDDQGRIFSRRMVRDERVRNARAAGGHAGAEHGHKGAEAGSKGGRPRTDKGGLSGPLKPSPSSSSSSSASSSEPKGNVELPLDAAPINGGNGHGKSRELREQAAGLIAFLNEQAGRSFEAKGANLEDVMARLRDGESVDDCRAVIVMKVREWKGNPEMATYLRPETLFGRRKFASYKGALGTAPAVSQRTGKARDVGLADKAYPSPTELAA